MEVTVLWGFPFVNDNGVDNGITISHEIGLRKIAEQSAMAEKPIQSVNKEWPYDSTALLTGGVDLDCVNCRLLDCRNHLELSEAGKPAPPSLLDTPCSLGRQMTIGQPR